MAFIFWEAEICSSGFELHINLFVFVRTGTVFVILYKGSNANPLHDISP
jgi:hypothetical protein